MLEGERPLDLPSSNLHFGVEPSRFVAYPTNGRSPVQTRRYSSDQRMRNIAPFPTFALPVGIRITAIISTDSATDHCLR